jgi:hypothetical protein
LYRISRFDLTNKFKILFQIKEDKSYNRVIGGRPALNWHAVAIDQELGKVPFDETAKQCHQ